MTTTPTGIPIRYCEGRGHTHPVSRRYCSICGLARAFPHEHPQPAKPEQDTLPFGGAA